MSLQTLDDRLAFVSAQSRCTVCGTESDSLVPAMLIEVCKRGDDGRLEMQCELCCAKPVSRAQVAPPMRLDPWETVCTPVYSLESEGGQTDAKRLAKAWGEKSDTKERLTAGQIRDLIFTHNGPILLGGDPGAMKTRLAWRMVHAVWKKPAQVHCFTSWSFQAELQDAGGNHQSRAWMKTLTESALVFIDDLGKAEWTANTHGAFFELVEARIAHRRPLLITTNESFSDLKAARTGHKSAVAQSSGEALLRRFREYAITVVMQKPSKAIAAN